MVTIQTSHPCILTDSREAVVVSEKDRYGKPLRNVICRESGLVFVDPRPSHREVEKFYTESYRKQYKGTEVPDARHVYRAGKVALRRMALLGKYLEPGSRVLDVGSGGGEMLYLLRNRGYEAYGIEPNVGYAEHAIAEYGAQIQVGFSGDAAFAPGYFDAICLFHILEHLENPLEEIRSLMALLKPGGMFFVRVPNVEFNHCYPSTKWHVGHLYNFNVVTLTATFDKVGLTPLAVNAPTDGGTLFGVFQKGDAPAKPVGLDGNFEKVLGKLRAHTVPRYLSSLHPYIRVFRKVARNLGESLAIRKASGSRQLLDGLYGKTSVE